MYEIKSSPLPNVEPDFYIQSVGSNSGRPMKAESANCFYVYCDGVNLLGDYFYYVVLHAFNSGYFDSIRRGSAIPFLTIDDIYSVL